MNDEIHGDSLPLEPVWGIRLPLFPEWEAAQRAKFAGKPKGRNPCIALYGRGPEGAICGECVHLKRVRYHTRQYPKCGLRTETHGAGTDHRVKWPTCGRFEAKGEGAAS